MSRIVFAQISGQWPAAQFLLIRWDDAGSPNQADELVATEYRPRVNGGAFPNDARLSITFHAGEITARPMLATVVTERKIEKENPIYQLLPASKYTAIELAGARVSPRFPGDTLCSFDERVF